MIKSSGYRISPTEVEEVIYATKLVGECAAFGLPHPTLGEVVVLVVTALDGTVPDTERLLALCREKLPAYMVPAHIEPRVGSLPRNANGKIDRKSIASDLRAAREGGTR
jgi:acyl-CoA synthetase (AMP-forming)/AMP-acid ligase II